MAQNKTNNVENNGQNNEGKKQEEQAPKMVNVAMDINKYEEYQDWLAEKEYVEGSVTEENDMEDVKEPKKSQKAKKDKKAKRKDKEEKMGFGATVKSHWKAMLLAGGVVAAGVGTIVLLSGNDDDKKKKEVDVETEGTNEEPVLETVTVEVA
jgi:hypothetical protein